MDAIVRGKLPGNLKLTDVTPFLKKKNPLDTINYRPVSVLSTISEIFEKPMGKQLNHYIKIIYLHIYVNTGKVIVHSKLYLSLLKVGKLDNYGFRGATLLDLTMDFDTLSYELLLAKLHAYGFDESSVKLLRSYLSNRWCQQKIHFLGLPHGSVFGLLLFNIYLNDLLFLPEYTDACNFADDIKLHAFDKDINF